MRPSCHHDGNFYAGKKASFHWIGPLVTEKPSHIEADKNGWQKWTKTWGHFHFYFCAWKVLDFDSNYIKIGPQGSNQQ